jgi:hypothetical protein
MLFGLKASHCIIYCVSAVLLVSLCRILYIVFSRNSQALHESPPLAIPGNCGDKNQPINYSGNQNAVSLKGYEEEDSVAVSLCSQTDVLPEDLNNVRQGGGLMDVSIKEYSQVHR